jgi:hypothetical protein
LTLFNLLGQSLVKAESERGEKKTGTERERERERDRQTMPKRAKVGYGRDKRGLLGDINARGGGLMLLTLNLRCSISWAIASAGGRGFFSHVSDFFSFALSNSVRAARLESRAIST